MVSSPLNNVGRESDKTSRSFCGHVNFPELNGGDKCIWGTKLNNLKEGVSYHLML